MVAIRAGDREVPVLKPADVRFGSKADMVMPQMIASTIGDSAGGKRMNTHGPSRRYFI